MGGITAASNSCHNIFNIAAVTEQIIPSPALVGDGSVCLSDITSPIIPSCHRHINTTTHRANLGINCHIPSIFFSGHGWFIESYLEGKYSISITHTHAFNLYNLKVSLNTDGIFQKILIFLNEPKWLFIIIVSVMSHSQRPSDRYHSITSPYSATSPRWIIPLFNHTFYYCDTHTHREREREGEIF